MQCQSCNQERQIYERCSICRAKICFECTYVIDGKILCASHGKHLYLERKAKIDRRLDAIKENNYKKVSKNKRTYK